PPPSHRRSQAQPIYAPACLRSTRSPRPQWNPLPKTERPQVAAAHLPWRAHDPHRRRLAALFSPAPRTQRSGTDSLLRSALDALPTIQLPISRPRESTAPVEPPTIGKCPSLHQRLNQHARWPRIVGPLVGIVHGVARVVFALRIWIARHRMEGQRLNRG